MKNVSDVNYTSVLHKQEQEIMVSWQEPIKMWDKFDATRRFLFARESM